MKNMKYADLKKGDIIQEYTNDCTIITYEVYQEDCHWWFGVDGEKERKASIELFNPAKREWIMKDASEAMSDSFQSVYRDGMLIFG